MKQIKVLVSSCNCNQKFAELVENVVKNQGIDAQVTKVEDIVEVMQYNLMSLPALVVDEVVVARGSKTEAELIEILKA
ncbi:MAG: thioredoxin family protein [Bacteroidales bacterium]|nr:thioredoxin family protein [Candidatus Physcocola equi]